MGTSKYMTHVTASILPPPWLRETQKKLQHTGVQHTATHYTATHCNTHCNTLQHTATHCNKLQHTAKHRNNTQSGANSLNVTILATATYCNAVHHTATPHCNTSTHCNNAQSPTALPTLWRSLFWPQPLTLQQTATQCNTLQHTSPYWPQPLAPPPWLPSAHLKYAKHVKRDLCTCKRDLQNRPQTWKQYQRRKSFYLAHLGCECKCQTRHIKETCLV